MKNKILCHLTSFWQQIQALLINRYFLLKLEEKNIYKSILYWRSSIRPRDWQQSAYFGRKFDAAFYLGISVALQVSFSRVTRYNCAIFSCQRKFFYCTKGQKWYVMLILLAHHNNCFKWVIEKEGWNNDRTFIF